MYKLWHPYAWLQRASAAPVSDCPPHSPWADPSPPAQLEKEVRRIRLNLITIHILQLTPSYNIGYLPTFHPTSSPALDELLSTFRTNIFLPAQLSAAQRKLVFRKKNHHLLTGDEPATATIGSEVVQMLPLDHLRDEPDIDSLILSAKQAMMHGKICPSF